MTPPYRAGYLLWMVLCTTCTQLVYTCRSNTPSSYLHVSDLCKIHLPHWNNPSSIIDVCDSVYVLACLGCQDCNLFCPGGREVSHLLGGSHWCLWWLIWQAVLLQLSSCPISPGADFVPFLVCLLSDALGSADGWSWTLKGVDYPQCKACTKALRHLFLQQVWWIICLTERRRKKPLFSHTIIVITIINIR